MKKENKKILVEESIKTLIGSIGLLIVAGLVFLLVDSKLIEIQHDLQQRETRQSLQAELAKELLSYYSILSERSSSLHWCADQSKRLIKRQVSYVLISELIDECYDDLKSIDKQISKQLYLGTRASVILDQETALLFTDLASISYRTESVEKQKKVDAVITQLAEKEQLGKITLKDLLQWQLAIEARIGVMESNPEILREKYVFFVKHLEAKGYLGIVTK